MRTLIPLLLLCACSPKTCEDLGYVSENLELFSPEVVSAGGQLYVDWDLGNAGEVWLEDTTGEVWWHIRCDEADGYEIPSCLESHQQIGAEAPSGATAVIEPRSLEEGPTYKAVVREHDYQCDGQLRGGESVEFTVTVNSNP